MPVNEYILCTKHELVTTKRVVYLADQLGIDLPTCEALIASFACGHSLLDPTRPDTGTNDSTYCLRINVKPGTLVSTESARNGTGNTKQNCFHMDNGESMG